MWIFTNEGFFSVVEVRDNSDELMVRARRRGDLEAFIRVSAASPDTTIIETKHADYRYRVIVPRDAWVEYVAQAARGIDYTNVKATIGRGHERHQAMMQVWHAMRQLQIP